MCLPLPGLLQLCQARGKRMPAPERAQPAPGEPTSPPSCSASPSRGGIPSQRWALRCTVRRQDWLGDKNRVILAAWKVFRVFGEFELNFKLSGAFPVLVQEVGRKLLR